MASIEEWTQKEPTDEQIAQFVASLPEDKNGNTIADPTAIKSFTDSLRVPAEVNVTPETANQPPPGMMDFIKRDLGTVSDKISSLLPSKDTVASGIESAGALAGGAAGVSVASGAGAGFPLAAMATVPTFAAGGKQLARTLNEAIGLRDRPESQLGNLKEFGADTLENAGLVGGAMLGAPGGVLPAATMATTGQSIGSQLAQFLGLKPDQSTLQKIESYLSNLGVNTLTGGLLKTSGSSINQSPGEPPPPIDPTNPSTQAALRYSENYPPGSMLGKGETADGIIASGKVSPTQGRAIDMAQSKASNPLQLGSELGYPESKSARGVAAAEALSKEANNIYDTGIFLTDGPIDPLSKSSTGNVNTFQSSGQQRILSIPEQLQRIDVSKNELMESRDSIVSNLDEAMQTYNSRQPDKINGIAFDLDLAPQLTPLKQKIAELRKLGGTTPAADGIQAVLTDVETSINNIQKKTDVLRLPPPFGDPRPKGELTIKDATDIVKNINRMRQSFKEFDELVKAQQINATFSDVTGHGAALEGLKPIHRALTNAIETKSGEILSKAKTLDGIFNWSEILNAYDANTIRRINNTYGALDKLEEPLKNHLYDTQTMEKGVSPQSLQSQLGAEGIKEGIIPTSPRGMIAQGLNKGIGAVKEAISPSDPRGLQIAEAANSRLTAPMQNLRDLAFIRANPVPRLPRTFDQVRSSPDLMKALGMRAVALGIIKTGEEAMALPLMPAPQQEAIYKATIMSSGPDGVEASPYGFRSLIDGKLEDPMEKDAFMRMVYNKKLPPGDEARILGPLLENGTFVPMDTSNAAPMSIQPPAMDMPRMNSILSESMEAPSLRQQSDSHSMLKDLEKSAGMIDEKQSGL